MKSLFKKLVVAIITFEARLVLKKYRPKIVAVTGNVGKTSTKDALFLVLSEKYFVRKSTRSYNSDIGVPLAILGLSNAWSNPVGWIGNIAAGALLALKRHRYPEWLILEVGADRPGDIRSIAAWVKPDVVVVTRFQKTPVHIEFFPSRDALLEEKRHLVRALKDGGTLILNADDPDALSFGPLASGKVLTFGTAKGAALTVGAMGPVYQRGVRGIPDGYRVQMKAHGALVSISWRGSLGVQHASALAAAATFGLFVAELPRDTIVRALGDYEAPQGRMRLVKGIKKTTIIDDTYNASPLATSEALRVLWELTVVGRRIAVLGDMLELGKFASEEHKEAGRLAAESAHTLVNVGIRARGIAEGARSHGMSESNIFSFDNAREAGAFLREYLRDGDVVLVKGSQSMRMERAVEAIMAHPEQKETLLVRQDEEWLKIP